MQIAEFASQAAGDQSSQRVQQTSTGKQTNWAASEPTRVYRLPAKPLESGKSGKAASNTLTKRRVHSKVC